MMDSDSSSDDDVVITPCLMRKLPMRKGGEYCANNNNNEAGISKVHQYSNSAFETKQAQNGYGLLNENGVVQKEPTPSRLDCDENGFKYQKHDISTKRNSPGCLENIYNQGLKRDSREDINGGSEAEIGAEDLNQNGMTGIERKSSADVSVNSFRDLNPLRKNNTFPLVTEDPRLHESFGISFLDGAVLNPHHSREKRFLPPINKVASKRNRIHSETDVEKLSGPLHPLPVITGSPAKTQPCKDSDAEVKFQVGEDELSDQEEDTSTSSGNDAELTESSSDEKELEMFEGPSSAHKTIISERLQKLYRGLRLEDLRGSPTASTFSAPVGVADEELSSSDEEDNRSVCSDSKVIRARSGTRKNRFQSKRDHLVHNSTLPGTSDLTNSQYMADFKHEEAIPNSMDVMDDDDSVPESVSGPPQAGILPAIPSHGVRERNFLVGNLTKHGSLLGADELHRYFPNRQLRLFVGTWNMQRKGVPRNLNDFLLPEEDKYLQDMYVIGVQESTQDQKKWEVKLQETLGPNHVLAHSVSHGVLHLAIFIRRDLIWFCSPFEEDRVTTRMVSQIKTKGAVAISFLFFGTSMLFLTSHFHSGETRVKERVEDYNRINEKLKLPKDLPCNTYKSSPNDVSSRFDCTFWFGDLNFRVSQPHQIMHQEVKDPEKYDFKEVLKGDQLTATKRRGAIFRGYTEPNIRFLPTYKFVSGTDTYDSSPKLRVPSYTDRILYKSKDPDMILCNKYDSITTVKKSDHRPVYALFEVSLKPGRDSIPLGGGRFRHDVYKKGVGRRGQASYPSNSTVCVIL